MELEDIDLNLLVVFNQLMKERKVSAVADNLGLGQPAVSNALARLRKLFDDPMFLRTPSGMQPTPFADQLAESVGYALAMIHGAVNEKSTFNPATSTRSFSVAMTDIGEIYFLPTLMQAIQRCAPAIAISTVHSATDNLKGSLEAGQIDLAIGFLPQLTAGFFQQRLFSQRYVLMYRNGHQLGKQDISSDDFFNADHVGIVSAGTGHGKIDALLDSGERKRRIRLKVPHFVAVPHILQSTDMVATVPLRLAEKMANTFALTYTPHPIALPEIAINLFWHAKHNKDPANQWLRGLVFDTHGTA
jgi:DNA-binding transcriptional LysR family regulator